MSNIRYQQTWMTWGLHVAIIGFCSFPFSFAATAQEQVNDDAVDWRAGFSRLDITPTEPLRLAGYGSRRTPSEGVETPLHVRCMVLQASKASDPSAVMLSVDTIGLPGELTKRITSEIERLHDIPRKRITVCSTHTHCAPDLVSELSNIFSVPLTEQEREAGIGYKEMLLRQAIESVGEALNDLQPVQLAYATGEVSFAANRRVLRDGKWAGFGVQADGPVDHSVPTLRIIDANGQLRGVVFNYACHCTTLGGQYNRVNAEWAGYACRSLEADHPDAVALCTIGCGADANPEPRESLEAAKVHGRTLAAEVERLIAGEMEPVTAPLEVRFDYSALAFDLPTPEELQQRAESSNPQEKRHAEQMLEIYERNGRLPANYPVPIQSWRFGDDLTMIFIGGEVVVDYALRLKQTFDDPDLWVTAYANDVLGYIASERMRIEEGYEYDRSGIYYGLPGPWAAGTEDRLIESIEKLVESKGRPEPQAAEESLQSLRLSEPGMRIELVAAEPLVADPINIAFDIQGRLWVVEMGDYPEGEQGGRIKRLEDTDGDGRFDTATTFLDQLDFPTGVQPWKDGVLITAAPDILFARDTDGDGRADEVEKRFTGFRLANPQHRINGFAYGLDHSLHLASGDNLSEITSVLTGEKINASGKDLQIWPDSGRIKGTSGRTQYIRSRDDWGNWFGNDNSRPMYHYPLEERYLRRNPSVSFSSSQQQLFEPAAAPPVYPLTSANERFNDLYAANRFTSACSSIIARSPFFQFNEAETAFVCEPVHNLVHRAKLVRHGATYRATRSEADQESEFLASSDPWFRPVRVTVGPDGALWVVDMYREVIEHPEWIPESWQQNLNLRAGEQRGRIYRIVPDTEPKASNWNGATATEAEDITTETLLEWLHSPVGPRRDLAQQHLIERLESDSDLDVLTRLRELLMTEVDPRVRLHALSILAYLEKLGHDLLQQTLQDSHPGLLIAAMRAAEPRLDSNPDLVEQISHLAGHSDAQVALQAALTLGQTDQPIAGAALAKIATTTGTDVWVANAVRSSAPPHAETILASMLDVVRDGTDPLNETWLGLLSDILVTAQKQDAEVAPLVQETFAETLRPVAGQLAMVKSIITAFRKAGLDPASVSARFAPLYQEAMDLVADPRQPDDLRVAALELSGLGLGAQDVERQLLLDLLQPSVSATVQRKTLDQLIRNNQTELFAKILERWPAMTHEVRTHAVSRMLSFGNWRERLVDALEANAIRVADLSPAARQQLLQSGSRSMKVRTQRLFAESENPDKQALIAKYLPALDTQPDPSAGAALYRQHCGVCHQPENNRRAVGANLTNLSSLDGRVLLESILDPNRAVEPAFHRYIIQTSDDRIVAGAIEEEIGSSLTIAAADGERITLNRDQIVSMKNTGTSLMPEGLEAVLSPEQMRDVIHYLQHRPQ